MTDEPRTDAPKEHDAADQSAPGRGAAAPRRGEFGKRLGLIVFLSTPLLVLALLMWVIASSLTQQANDPESLERHRQQQTD